MSLTHEDKLALFLSLAREFTSPQSDPDYIVYDVGYLERLHSGATKHTIWSHMRKLRLESEMLFMRAGGDVDFNVHRPLFAAAAPFGLHPEAPAVHAALQAQGLDYCGIVVKHASGFGVSEFTACIMQANHCAGLDLHPFNVKASHIRMDGKIKLVLCLKFDTESG